MVDHLRAGLCQWVPPSQFDNPRKFFVPDFRTVPRLNTTSLQLLHVMPGSSGTGDSSAPFQVPTVVCRDPPPVLCYILARIGLATLVHRHTGIHPGLLSGDTSPLTAYCGSGPCGDCSDDA